VMSQVASAQVLRLAALTAATPILLATAPIHAVHPVALSGLQGLAGWSVLLVGTLIGWLLVGRMKWPSASFLGPMAASALLHGSGLVALSFPRPMVMVASAALGAIVGTRFSGVKPMDLLRFLPTVLVALVVMTGIALGAGWGAGVISGVGPTAGVLAFAPGSMDVMIAISLAVGASPAYVTAHQTARLLMELFRLRFAPDARRSYYVSYNRGYKGPAADLSRLAIAANAFLKPEKAGAFEAGAKATMADGRLIANVAVFHQTVKDVQQSAVVANSGGITQLANAGDLRSYGLELDVAARPSRELRLEGGLAYTHAEFRDFINACFPFQTAAQGCNVATQSQDLTGARPQQAPRFSGNLAATYDIALPSMPFDAFVKVAYAYQSRVQFGLTNDPLLREGGHGSLDATLGLNGRDDRWQLLIYGKNLTNDVFYAYKFSANGFLTRVSANLTRDYKRYGGVMLRAKF